MPKTVLIVESNKFLLDAMTSLFPLLGFTVVGTTSKISDVDTLALKTKPDLLVFDLELSKENMAEIPDLNHLKEQLPEMKFLALGAHVTAHLLEIILNAGFDAFWNKYDDSEEFIKCLERLFP